MGDNNKKYKEQLYPDKDKQRSQCWKYMLDKKDEFVPAFRDAGQIDCLINQLVKYNQKLKQCKADYEELDRIDNKKENLKEFLNSAKNNDFNKQPVIEQNIEKLLRGICIDISEEEKKKLSSQKLGNSEFTADSIKIDIVKGSIYKIKKYFLENNNLKDIRGGSMMIDHLNTTVVTQIIEKKGFSESNIIYCGGGNIFLVVPSGYGQELCEDLETEFTRISLTVMSAFETIECKLSDLLFDFSKVKGKIELMVTERSKMKFYEIDPDPSLKDNDKIYGCDEIYLDLTQVDRDNGVIKKANEKDSRVSFIDNKKEADGVCELCHTREAKHVVDKLDPKKACESCYRKHMVGMKKGIFFEGYEEYIITNPDKDKYINEDFSFKMKYADKLNSIDDIAPEIAVIYGDGNNMGNVVKNIKNIFEMMYFSRRTDEITKHSVYNAIYHAMKNEAKFEVIGLGGDDIFIIVPAKYAFQISNRIIENFDREFKNSITMSVGIAIAKSATPVTSLFALAQQRLKSAKKLVKNDKSINEGTIDIIELIGDMHVSSKNDKIILEKLNDIPDKISYKFSGLEDSNQSRLFPMTKSDFEACGEKIKYIDSIDPNLRTQLYKIGYAKENMCEEEFQLFYYYQNSKNKSNNIGNDKKYTVHELVNTLNDCCACDKNNHKSKKKLKCSECEFDNPDNKEQKCKKTRHKFNNYNPINVDWNELILMYERETEDNKKGKE